MLNIQLKNRNVPTFLQAYRSEGEEAPFYVSGYILYKGRTLIEVLLETEEVKFVPLAGQTRKRYPFNDSTFLFVIHIYNEFPHDLDPLSILDLASEFWIKCLEDSQRSLDESGLNTD